MEESGKKEQFSKELAEVVEKGANGKEAVAAEDEEVVKMVVGTAAYNLSEGRRIGVGSLVEVITHIVTCHFM